MPMLLDSAQTARKGKEIVVVAVLVYFLGMASASISDVWVPRDIKSLQDQPLPTTPDSDPKPTPEPALTQEPELAEDSGLPKPWNIEDPFQFVPPIPEGDHWEMLLEPYIKGDQTRCDTWRDEVQNLLIFAGLFSAVVTAFIIESYKNLQQNPNDVMISLLAQIVQRLDGPTNDTSSVPLPVQKTFSPSASTIRVNNFWFISLVLSLTTVLVGIVSLQWLREHQNFPDLSSRERYAVAVLRNRALGRWYVDKIFTAMPLLLQCALILFLGGLVDFIHAFGNRNVLIPVSIAVALTLFFIVATTLLPSLQILSLYFRIPGFGLAKGRWVEPPYPCPYKSPQSHAFRQLFRPLALLFHRIYPRARSTVHDIQCRIGKIFSSTPIQISSIKDDDFTRYLRSASISEDWMPSDPAWLAIRDGYSRRAYGRSSVDDLVGRSWKINALLGGRDNEVVPIRDIIGGIVSQGYDKDTSPLAYHAFNEISQLTLLPLQRPDYYYQTPEDLFRQSAYLHDLLIGGVSKDTEATLTDIFDFDDLLFKPLPGIEELQEGQTTLDNVPAMLIHHQNTSYYLRYHSASNAPMLSTHRTELEVRLIRYFCLEHPETRDAMTNANSRYPSCLVLTRFESYYGSDFRSDADFNIVAWQVGNAILLVLQQLDTGNHEHESRPNIFLNILLAQTSLLSFMDTATFFSSRSLQYTPPPPPPPPVSNNLDTAVQDTFYAIISLFEDRLNKEMLSWTKPEGKPTLFFYLASLYVQPLIVPLRQNSRFLSLLSTICKYKRRTIDMDINDTAIEDRLNSDPNSEYIWFFPDRPFSPLWWHEFDPPTPVSGSTPHSRNSPSIVMYYPFSTSENSLPHQS